MDGEGLSIKALALISASRTARRSGDRSRSKKNKKYVIDAVAILKRKPRLASGKMLLWRAVLRGKKKSHNGQMDVVIALWNNNFIKV